MPEHAGSSPVEPVYVLSSGDHPTAGKTRSLFRWKCRVDSTMSTSSLASSLIC